MSTVFLNFPMAFNDEPDRDYGFAEGGCAREHPNVMSEQFFEGRRLIFPESSLEFRVDLPASVLGQKIVQFLKRNAAGFNSLRQSTQKCETSLAPNPTCGLVE